jgi:hypothetical protein
MHDLPALPDPLFSASARTTGGTDNRTVDAPQLAADIADFDMRRAQAPDRRIQGAVAVPLIKQTPSSLPLSELFRQITPWSAGAQNPKDPIEHITTILRRATGRRRFPEQILNALPLVV